MAEVHNLSLFLLEAIEEERVSGDLALAACALTLVRLAHPYEPLSKEDEMSFTSELVSMVQLQGGVKH